MVVKGHQVVNVRRRGEPPRARWIYGINAVSRRLEVDPASVLEVRRSPRAAARIDALARRASPSVSVRDADDATLRQLSGTTAHQGVAARTRAFRYADAERVLERPGELLLVLDHVQDPHNLGALVRTAAAVDVAAVFIPRDGAAGVTPSVEKVAAGAVNDVPICQIVNIPRLLQHLRRLGFWLAALVPRDGVDVFAADVPRPLAVVLGGETGLRPLVERSCDLRLSIPMWGPAESLNTSVAGAIGLYEIRRKWRA